MPNPSPTVPSPERPTAGGGAAAAALPAELESRIASLERAADDADFDAASWRWMLLLGVLLPAAAIGVGWWLEAVQ
jgi:hypothetical protein